MRSAKVRRAKLYYLRDLKGKAARMKDAVKSLGAAASQLRLAVSMTRVPAMRTLENALRRVGFVHVAGVDEVGRGCLAGPVVAAAVVLHPDRHIPGVCDSKTGAGAPSASGSTTASCATRSPGRSPRPIRPRSIASTSIRRRCARCSARCSRWRRCPTSCSSTRSACRSCRWRSAACRTATAAARRSPRRRSSPR